MANFSICRKISQTSAIEVADRVTVVFCAEFKTIYVIVSTVVNGEYVQMNIVAFIKYIVIVGRVVFICFLFRHAYDAVFDFSIFISKITEHSPLVYFPVAVHTIAIVVILIGNILNVYLII